MTTADALKSHLKTATLPASGRVYEYLDVPAAAAAKGTLVLLHGWPDSWYGWRQQIQPWAQRGFRIIAPSALGYGGTDKPTDPAEYTWRKLADDLDALLDVAVGKDERVFVVSHDWGAFTGWRYLQWHGARVKAFCSVSIPFIAPQPQGSPYAPIEAIVQRMPALSYQLFLNEPTAHAELDAHRERFLDILYQPPDVLAQSGIGKPGGFKAAIVGSDPVDPVPFWSADDHTFYNDYFATSGFEATLGYYRSYHAKWAEEASSETATPPPALPAAVPKLVVHPTKDSVAIPALMDATALIPNTQVVKVEGAGHWVLQTHGAEVEKVVGEWLAGVAAGDDGAKL